MKIGNRGNEEEDSGGGRSAICGMTSCRKKEIRVYICIYPAAAERLCERAAAGKLGKREGEWTEAALLDRIRTRTRRVNRETWELFCIRGVAPFI